MSNMNVEIVYKKKDGKAFKDKNNTWYNINDVVIPYLAKVNVGDTINIEYIKKGTAIYVSKLMKTEAKQEEVKFKCVDCGAELKTDKYKKCYTCNKKSSKTAPSTAGTKTKPEYIDKTAQIQRGNALNAASMASANQQFINSETGEPDPAIAGQYVKILAEDLLDWLRSE